MADSGIPILSLPATVTLLDTDVLPLGRLSGSTAPGTNLGITGAALKKLAPTGNSIPGTDKRVRFQTNAQLAAATDGGDSLDGLNPATLVLGGLAWVEFHPLGYGTTLRLLYDGAPRTPAGSGLRAYRTGDFVAGDTVPVRWVVATGPEVGVTAYPQRPAGYVFALNELVRAYVSDVLTEQFFAANFATALPAPTVSAGDANWRAVSPGAVVSRPDLLLGDWNPNTNTPALVAGMGTTGTYYRVSTDSLTKTPLVLFTATASTQLTITNVFQIAVGFTLTGGGLGAGITVTAIDATNKIITLSAAVSLTAGTQLFFSQTTLGLSRLRVDSQLFFTGTAWIARNNAPVTTAAVGGLARAGRGLSANGLGSLATDWPDFKNEILCPANTTTGAVLGNAYALALNGSLAFAGQDTADFGPYYLGQLLAVRALDNVNGGVTWGIKFDGTAFTAGGDATTVLKAGDFIVARRTLTGYDIVLDGRKSATASTPAFVTITQNQYGTHPAFSTQTALNAYLLGGAATVPTLTTPTFTAA